MKKRTVRKGDGRYLIFYAFEKSMPDPYTDQIEKEVPPSGTKPRADLRAAGDPQVGPQLPDGPADEGGSA